MKRPVFHFISIILFAAVWIAIAGGCSEDVIKSNDFKASYFGELHWDKTPGVPMGSGIDTVRLIIDGNKFDYLYITNKGNFCDASGQVNQFGTNSAEFIVTILGGDQCDSVRILRGQFATIFRNDSLLMTGNLRDGIRQMDYDYRLAEQIAIP